MKLIIDVPDNIIEDAKSSPNYYPIYHFEKMWRAIINGTSLDKIRAEIENDWQLKKYPSSPFSCGLRRAIEIIDKYKAESEDKE